MKKLSLVILALVAILAAAGFASLRLAGAASSSPNPSKAASSCDPRGISVFGYIKSLTPSGERFELRFDPALVLTGATATQAALEDTGSGDIANDNYFVNESLRAYTYVVPATARVKVLTPPLSLSGTAITVEQLAQLVKGEQPVKLFEPIKTGFWMHYYNDSVCSLTQQYIP